MIGFFSNIQDFKLFKVNASKSFEWQFVLNLIIVLNFLCQQTFSQTSPSNEILIAKAQHYYETGIDGMPGEPMIVQHPDGSLYLGGYVYPKYVALYQSRDLGLNWQKVDLKNENNPELGNSDIDLTIAPNGSVHMAAMHWGDYEGAGISVVSSRNGTDTWIWNRISQVLGDDRPWIRATPDETIHLIWNNRNGINYVRSSDNGQNWERQPLIYPEGKSSHFAAGPNGELAIRITPRAWTEAPEDPNKDYIAVSLDGGNSWSFNKVPGDRSSKSIHRHVEPIGWDNEGALYYAWSEVNSLWLARSDDKGKNWYSERVYESNEKIFYPYIAVKDIGEVGLTWMEGWNETQCCFAGRISYDVQANTFKKLKLRALFWESLVILDKSKSVDGNLSDEQYKGFIEPPRVVPTKGAGEYEPVIFLKNGQMAVATEVYNAVENRYGFRTHILDYSKTILPDFSEMGIIGTATYKGWESSTPMKKSETLGIWELEVALKIGELKFRANDDWKYNWGGGAFPDGEAVFYGYNIPISQTGIYHITFDLNNFQYKFEKIEN